MKEMTIKLVTAPFDKCCDNCYFYAGKDSTCTIGPHDVDKICDWFKSALHIEEDFYLKIVEDDKH